MYEIFEKLLEQHGVSAYKVAMETGVPQSTISDWKRGRCTPKQDKLQKIADYFGVSIDYLMTGKEIEHYYINDDARDMAQFMFENPEYKVLFDASRKIAKEDIDVVAKLLRRFGEDESE